MFFYGFIATLIYFHLLVEIMKHIATVANTSSYSKLVDITESCLENGTFNWLDQAEWMCCRCWGNVWRDNWRWDEGRQCKCFIFCIIQYLGTLSFRNIEYIVVSFILRTLLYQIQISLLCLIYSNTEQILEFDIKVTFFVEYIENIIASNAGDTVVPNIFYIENFVVNS